MPLVKSASNKADVQDVGDVLQDISTNALKGTIVEVTRTVSLGQETLRGEISGCLTGYGAGCIITALESAGLKIVERRK